jgi:hypothetical protein
VKIKFLATETTGSGILFTPIVGVEEEPFLSSLLKNVLGSAITNEKPNTGQFKKGRKRKISP